MTGPHSSTTTSLSTEQHASAHSETPGFVLVYSRLHAHLPSCVSVEAKLQIGRESDNGLVIGENAVSRHHARAVRSGDQVVIEDLQSTNGTLVNGRPVKQQVLAAGDLVRVGDTLFRFVSEDVYGYGPYRIDGTRIDSARRFTHAASEHLVGGFQIDRLVAMLDKVASAGLSVVVHGQSGTGKELVAEELHRRSGRSGPLQAINCAALPANLLESELFGYRKGAFTGASADKIGLIRAANAGTLFLDEIGDMPLEAQAKLLRVLQQREVLPLGATRPEPIDVRVVCATHRDLSERVTAGLFRGDLLARLRQVELRVPPLSERLEDLYSLVRHFLKQAGKPGLAIDFDYMLCLAHHEWTYNVRELESAVALSLALHEFGPLSAALLPPNIQQAPARRAQTPAPAAAPPPVTAPTENQGPPTAEELEALLVEHKGNVAAVGRALGKERMQIHRWAKRYGLVLDSYRD